MQIKKEKGKAFSRKMLIYNVLFIFGGVSLTGKYAPHVVELLNSIP